MEAITREEKIMSGENLTPITRKEMFLAKAAGQDVETPTPITREEMFLSNISGGGASINVQPLSITENGTYTAPKGTAYSPIDANVASSGGGENKFNQFLTKTITEVTAEDFKGATSITDSVFSRCPELTTVTMSDSITSVDNSVFSRCPKLTNIKLSNNLETIGNGMFYNCSSLTNVEIPNSVKTIGNGMFEGSTPIPSIIIPDSVTTIGDSMFYKNRTIWNVTIGSGITSIGNSMFYDNFQHKTVTIRATTPPTIKSGTFANTPQTFIVPAASVEAYKSATNWSQYADKIVASEEF